MFAQSNYNDPQGIPPTRYRIHDIGCFITSFCNLESRFGGSIDPPGMNAFLRDRGLYIDVDDGVRDDVSWDTITQFDPNTVVTGIGGGTPPHNNSIVKFIYNGGNSTHFCLVNDINDGTIIDSWDGQIKSWNVYGGVKAWASYNNNVQGGDMPTIPTKQQVAEAYGKHNLNADGTATPATQADLDYYSTQPVEVLYAVLLNHETDLVHQLADKADYKPYTGPQLYIKK